ncbi:MAG: hypothetical protein K2X45_18495, partial [Phreatobacter sp.]|nr:hypothetical protein [Phreatobacter sp.]
MEDEHYIETVVELCKAQRGATKDNGDGSVTVSFRTKAVQLPKMLRDSPEGSSWIIQCQSEHNAYRFVATRGRLIDCSHGEVEMRFNLPPSALPDHALYGNKGEWVDMTLWVSANPSPYPYHIDKTERLAVVKRLATVCTDPSFHEFVEKECARRGVPMVPALEDNMDEFVSSETRATEHLYRLLGINSRREILETNKAAERE